MGAASGLHVIIFDEIDAICKQRGSMVSDCTLYISKIRATIIFSFK